MVFTRDKQYACCIFICIYLFIIRVAPQPKYKLVIEADWVVSLFEECQLCNVDINQHGAVASNWIIKMTGDQAGVQKAVITNTNIQSACSSRGFLKMHFCWWVGVSIECVTKLLIAIVFLSIKIPKVIVQMQYLDCRDNVSYSSAHWSFEIGWTRTDE